GDPYIVSQAARQATERGSQAHRTTLKSLCAALTAYGLLVESGRLVDAYSRLPSGPAIFEVKSINQRNERAQSRHALSQLYEYRYLHNLADASLWLVLSEKPTQLWLVDYLMKDRGINVLWSSSEGFAGPAKELLFAKEGLARPTGSTANN